MALHFNLKAVPQSVREDEHGNMSVVTNQLIWATMIVDVGAISPKTVDEFIRRLDLYQHGVGALLRTVTETGTVPRYITHAEVRAHMGLTCNVVTTSPAKWEKRFREMLARQADDAVRAYHRALADADTAIAAAA